MPKLLPTILAIQPIPTSITTTMTARRDSKSHHITKYRELVDIVDASSARRKTSSLSANAIGGRGTSSRLERKANMPKKITVTPNKETWRLAPSGGAKAPDTKFRTQRRAVEVGKKELTGQGGGELAIKGRDGTVREQNTVPPARDPRRSKG